MPDPAKDPKANPPVSTGPDLKAATESGGTQPVAAPAHLSAPTEASRLARLEQIALQSRPGFAVGPTEGIDTTVPGGKYLVDGVWKNADGEELNEDGSLKYPGRMRKDEFGRMTTVR